MQVPAFVSGGALPPHRRGTTWDGIAALWDLYATFCGLAGVDPHDKMAEAAGLPPVDSINMWPAWSSRNRNDSMVHPRQELAIGGALGNAAGGGPAHLTTTVEGIISGDYKLLVGTFAEAIWTGPQYPNASSKASEWATTADCTHGCLYDLITDPGEHLDIAQHNPQLVAQLKARIATINATVFSPHRGSVSPQACAGATQRYGGFWGPFVNESVLPTPGVW